MTIQGSISSLLLFVAIAGHAYAADRQLPGRVLRVIDGDSLILDVRGSQYRIELAGIDAPELGQPWGQAAAESLQRSLTGSFVVVQWSGSIIDGRVQGTLIARNRDVGLDQLYDGLAWSLFGDVTERPDQNHPYRIAEGEARETRRGLWSDDNPIPPWEWRRQRAPMN